VQKLCASNNTCIFFRQALKHADATDRPLDAVRACVVSGRIPAEYRLLLAQQLYESGLAGPQVLIDQKRAASADRMERDRILNKRTTSEGGINQSVSHAVGLWQQNNDQTSASVGSDDDEQPVLHKGEEEEEEKDKKNGTQPSPMETKATTTSTTSKQDDQIVTGSSSSPSTRAQSAPTAKETIFTSKNLFDAAWNNRLHEVRLD